MRPGPKTKKWFGKMFNFFQGETCQFLEMGIFWTRKHGAISWNHVQSWWHACPWVCRKGIFQIRWRTTELQSTGLRPVRTMSEDRIHDYYISSLFDEFWHRHAPEDQNCGTTTPTGMACLWWARATYVPYGIALLHNTSVARDKKTLFHVTCNLPCGILSLYAGSCCRWMEGPEGVMVG